MRKLFAWSVIVFYVYTTFFWLCGPSDLRAVMLTPTRDVFNYLGLWQEFAVFGPQPRHMNLHVVADITYEDGKKSEWAFRRIEQCDPMEKLIGERVRKYSIEHLSWPNKNYLCSHFTYWLAKQEYKQGRRPKQIELVRYWADTPPPEKGLGKPPVPHSNRYLFYTYNVPKEILQ